jgi:hypothetical protein
VGYARVRTGTGEHLAAAHTAAREAVEKYRHLHSAHPAAFASDLAGASTTLADILDAIGRHNEANELRQQVDS